LKKILIAGANGFVGKNLIEALSGDAEIGIHALVRSEAKGSLLPSSVKRITGDLLKENSLGNTGDYDAAFYLVHGLKDKDADFEYQESKAAVNFSRWMKRVGCKKIIYLGALGPESDESPHLRSRHLVGKILALSGIPVLEFRASIVIGAGSASFEMIKALSERLPFSPDFRKIENLCQPIALSDLMLYLKAALEWSESDSRILEIGGEDQISYSGLMKLYLKNTRRAKKTFKVPSVDDRVFKKLLDLVIPEMADVGKKLYDSLIHETTVKSRDALTVFPQIRPASCVAAMAKAVQESFTSYPPLWEKDMLKFLIREKLVHPQELTDWIFVKLKKNPLSAD
jgi:uncharacterized protein YbjT (DUF2867 family)